MKTLKSDSVFTSPLAGEVERSSSEGYQKKVIPAKAGISPNRIFITYHPPLMGGVKNLTPDSSLREFLWNKNRGNPTSC